MTNQDETIPMLPALTARDLTNTRNSIMLLRNQIKTGQIEQDFALRQITKLEIFLKQVEQEQEQREDAARFKVLYTVSRMLGRSLDLQEVLEQVMDAIIQLTNAERGFLMMTDDDGRIDVVVARNFDQQTLGTDDIKFSHTVTNYVLDSGSSILTTNATEDPRFAGQASIVTQSLLSIMATPLRTRGKVFGVVYVDNRTVAGLFSNDDLDALDTFSAQAAITLDNARLFSETDEELNKRVDQLRQLRRVDQQLNQTLDSDEAIALTLKWACQLSEATGGYLGLVDDEHLLCVHSYSETGEIPKIKYLETLYPQAMEIIDSKKSITFSEIEQTILMTPIFREQDVIGVVVLKQEHGQQFSDEQRDLVERIVNRAAITIENTQLYAAVQAADKAKTEFVGIVAHDLKAPMTGIKGYAELMLMDEVSDEHHDFLTNISGMVDRMGALVSDLADISRIESGQFFMDESVVSVSKVIRATHDGTMPQIIEHGHKLIKNIEPNLPDVWVDYYRLLQVLVNLISNAYKYTPEGGTITLSSNKEVDYVRFAVEDTGIGLSEADINKLGTKFWRASDRFTRSQPGTGLGFTIAKSLIKQMGGEIEISSEVGKGSKFSFRVPIAKE